MHERIQKLYAELALALGVKSLPTDDKGTVTLDVGDASSVTIFAEDSQTLMLVSPVMALPQEIDYGSTLWLLRRNFYDSSLTPFRIGCDTAGSLVIWGRVPVESVTGEALAGLVDALGEEADLIREELETDEG
jgi:hypothetical protein